MKRRLLILIAFCCCTTVLLGKTRSYRISNLKPKIKNQKVILSKIQRKINNLEKTLGETNSKYLNILNTRKQIEEGLFVSEEALRENQKRLKKSYTVAKKMLMGTVLGALDDNPDVARLLERKILEELLVKKVSRLDKEIKLNQKLSRKVESEKTRYQNFLNDEKMISELLFNLENKKRTVVQNYRIEKKKQEQYLGQVSLLKLKRHAHKSKKTRGLKISMPMDNFSKIEKHKNKKGIVFKFKKRRPVLATGDGKIVYSGNLSTYGNLIMIEHGTNIRSVLLGNFTSKLRKGSSVKKGQIIGYTNIDSGSEGRLYLEVRRKDKVKNVLNFMDRNWLAKK